MRCYTYGDTDIPAIVSDTKVYRLAERLGHSRCFYTNAICYFYPDIKPKGSINHYFDAATREHLIPKNRSTLLDDKAALNVVISSSLMNQILGNAPLYIKIEIKNSIQHNGLITEELNDDIGLKIAELAKYHINHYRIDNKFPWQPISFEESEYKTEAECFMNKMESWETMIFNMLLNKEVTL